jgi:hypothetical protein
VKTPSNAYVPDVKRREKRKGERKDEEGGMRWKESVFLSRLFF